MRGLKTLLIVSLLVRPVYADEKRAADIISYGTVITQVTLNTVHNWREPDRKKVIALEVTKIFFTVAASETIKQYIHEVRPDKSDNLSFWSEHTALAAVNMGYCYKVGFTLTLGTATGRVIAKKHHIWDTLAGAGAGMLIDQFIR